MEEGEEETCAVAFAEYLTKSAEGWDVCDFQELPPSSTLRASLPSSFRSDVAVQGVCPALALGSDFETSIPPSMLRRLRYYRRRLERTAAIRIEVARGANFETIFADLLRLHQARWKARGQSGALADGPVTQFHHEAASALMREGALRLYSLSIDGRTAASFYGFQLQGCTFYYLGGFAPEFESRDVGTVLVGYAIEQAVREGSNEFSFLRGNETYRYSGGARDHLNYRRFIHQTTQPENLWTPANDPGA